MPCCRLRSAGAPESPSAHPGRALKWRSRALSELGVHPLRSLLAMNPWNEKALRIEGGEAPRVLDLFSGCGGFSLGFQRAGFEIVGGVEIDPDAAASHGLNFHGSADGRHAQPRDITRTDPLELLRSWGHADPESAVDVIIGGPPCPAFTRVGRAKLREVHKDPRAHAKDPRAGLYLHYLGFVGALKPLAVVMENVPDIVSFSGRNVAEEICETLESLGYTPHYSFLDAASYGVPQFRERFILVGLHSSVAGRFVFPDATHEAREANQSRSTSYAATAQLADAQGDHLVLVGRKSELEPATSVESALSDLPTITGDPIAGAPVDSSWVQQHMSAWPRLERPQEHPFDHDTRTHTSRDTRLFRAMEPGEQYPRTWGYALRACSQIEADHRVGPCLASVEAASREFGRAAGALFDQFLGSAGLPQACSTSWQDLLVAHQRLASDSRAFVACIEAATAGTPDPILAGEWDLGDSWLTALHHLIEEHPAAVVRLEGVEGDLRGLRRVLQRRETFLRLVDEAEAALFYDPRPSPLDWLDGKRLRLFMGQLAESSAQDMEESALLRAALALARLAACLDVRTGLRARVIPPYDPGKFPNKWRKLDPKSPSRTLMAHLGKDTYSHIHYRRDEARTISVREAARLQSFPDGFRFYGSLNARYRQIGNAVPPLMAWRLGQQLIAALRSSKSAEASEAPLSQTGP